MTGSYRQHIPCSAACGNAPGPRAVSTPRGMTFFQPVTWINIIEHVVPLRGMLMLETPAPPKIAPPSPRTVFRPVYGTPPKAATRRIPQVRELLDALVSYYREPLSWAVLFVTSVMLCYVGGGAMFWFHSEYLGEGGPAISWQTHWLLDSTAGFVLLTPALFVVLPLATWAATNIVARLHPSAVPAGYAVLVGGTFAALTAPGPIAHDLLVGRGTWMANRVTEWLGDPSAPPSPHEHYGWLAEITQQVGFGIPLYTLLACLAVLLLRMSAMRWKAPQGL